MSAEWAVEELTFDLSRARGDMLFDTEVGGTGRNVAQPFERRSGTARLATNPALSDGDAILVLRFDVFGPGDDFRFTIDVDDQLAAGEMGPIMIGAGEIEGATVRATRRRAGGAVATAEGRFGDRNEASVGLSACS